MVHPPHTYTHPVHPTNHHPGSGGNALTITLDNFAASRSMEAGEAGVRASRCIFVQAFRALHHKDPRLLRSCWDGDRVFQVGALPLALACACGGSATPIYIHHKHTYAAHVPTNQPTTALNTPNKHTTQVTFRGENGSDAGGVFREGMSRVVEDLHNPQALDLLAPCPNARHGLPTNVDKSLPNPHLAGCPLAGEMLEFVGKLMGMSLRAHLCLPFQVRPHFGEMDDGVGDGGGLFMSKNGGRRPANRH